MVDETFMPQCKLCGDTYSEQRYRIGILLCLDCGDEVAHLKSKKYTIAPINKSNYMLITDLTQLKQLNPKRTT